MTHFRQIRMLLTEQKIAKEQIELFEEIYNRFLRQQEEDLDWDQLSSPERNSILDYNSLEPPTPRQATTLLSESCVCRLNGGLGTTMGCVGPKSVIEVKSGLSFLDLMVEQLTALNKKYNVAVPLILMNSFNTDQDTQKVIRKYDEILKIHTFRQNQFPRLRKDSLMPLSSQKYGRLSFYPPGHGDFYQSINQTGLLDLLIEQGKKYMFIANADNLGASIDINILNLMRQSNAPFIMEVTPKTRADVKGGTLIQTNDQRLRLLEIAQVPKNHVEEFKSVKKFKFFNTNNIWINLRELKEKLHRNSLHLDVIVNHKHVKQLPVIQLETAIGSGINSFEGSLAVNVPRARFVPIKKTDDLLMVQSDIFVFEDGVLRINKERQFEGLPLIRLGESIQSVEAYNNHFKSIPNILELDILTIVGNVYFGKNITLRGNVILVCDNGELHLPDNSHIENKVLTGNVKMGEL